MSTVNKLLKRMRESWENDEFFSWIQNDEGLYRKAHRYQPFDAASAEDWVRSMFPNGIPHAEEDTDWDAIDWQEMADDLNAI